jgi:hypothetical protein
MLDRAGRMRGTFAGVALYTPDDDGGLLLREEGVMSWPTFSGPASRDYHLKPSGDPGTLDVCFPDGRPFHRMGFAPSQREASHWCDPDSYRVSYSFHGSDRFGYSWDVAGPRKDLLLTSLLTRRKPA